MTSSSVNRNIFNSRFGSKQSVSDVSVSLSLAGIYYAAAAGRSHFQDPRKANPDWPVRVPLDSLHQLLHAKLRQLLCWLCDCGQFWVYKLCKLQVIDSDEPDLLETYAVVAQAAKNRNAQRVANR